VGCTQHIGDSPHLQASSGLSTPTDSESEIVAFNGTLLAYANAADADGALRVLNWFQRRCAVPHRASPAASCTKRIACFLTCAADPVALLAAPTLAAPATNAQTRRPT
jgi:AICAR transformylase/IMP cyclohydrolase PurH